MDTFTIWQARLAKLCVLATIVLILVGGMVTTSGAGMAAPTAPDVHGVLLNPQSPVTNTVWHEDPALFKEHGHRLVAMVVATLVGVLCAWLWSEWLGFAIAVVLMGSAGFVGKTLGLDGSALAHFRFWPAAFVFVLITIIRAKRAKQNIRTEHWLALVAFVAVCMQAVMGSLRVTWEAGGDYAAAMNLRTVHGIFAQIFLCVLVVLATRLSGIWREELPSATRVERGAKFSRMGWSLVILYLAQLSCAAYFRHRGLALAIPSWPAANGVGFQLGGSWLPEHWSHALGIHFLHTRLIPFLIFGHVMGMAIATAKRAGNLRLSNLSWSILAVVLLQIIMGVLIIVGVNGKVRSPHLVNTHVVLGATLIALATCYAVRARRLAPVSQS